MKSREPKNRNRRINRREASEAINYIKNEGEQEKKGKNHTKRGTNFGKFNRQAFSRHQQLSILLPQYFVFKISLFTFKILKLIPFPYAFEFLTQFAEFFLSLHFFLSISFPSFFLLSFFSFYHTYLLFLLMDLDEVNANYRNYVNRYVYQPYCWPPDLSLAELHARCSQSGPINQLGVLCPCCKNSSKKKVSKWWKRNISDDLKQHGAALPGYFQLIKYYFCFALMILLINSLYPIYATYYACLFLDTQQQKCLDVGLLFYLQFNTLIQILNQYGKQDMIDILLILQTAVFYVLLSANCFSVFFITFLNDSAKKQFKEANQSSSNRCLVFYNIQESIAARLPEILKSQGDHVTIINQIQLFQVKSYYENYLNRNKVYYHLLSLCVISENPLLKSKMNLQLQKYHDIVLEQKQKLKQFSKKIMVMFDDIQTCRIIHKMYKTGVLKKWFYGFRHLLHQFKLKKFEDDEIKLTTYQIGLGSDILWENLGQKLGVKMAIRIKTFFVATLFILMCYAILYYPIKFSLETHVKVQTEHLIKLSTFQKILPILTSFGLVGLSIYFRIYMQKLSEKRNPKDQLERSQFTLITCITFHVLFYIIIPTIFFMIPGSISQTIKLFIISQQARTFIVIQVLIVIIDLPYRIWRSKKITALSDQRVAFRYNQQMLHRIVQSRDYPLQIRLQVLFRIWSLVLFYSFFIPYIMFYIVIAFIIIYWVQKKNLYQHYTIKRKVSIRLESDILKYYINFFCIYLCFIYCYTVRGNDTKIIVAVTITVAGLVSNILYWVVLNKGESKVQQIMDKGNENDNDNDKESSLLKKQKLYQLSNKFSVTYFDFLKSIKNDKLDEEITHYLIKARDAEKQKQSLRKSRQSIELSQIEVKTTQDMKLESQNEHDEEIEVDELYQRV